MAESPCCSMEKQLAPSLEGSWTLAQRFCRFLQKATQTGQTSRTFRQEQLFPRRGFEITAPFLTGSEVLCPPTLPPFFISTNFLSG